MPSYIHDLECGCSLDHGTWYPCQYHMDHPDEAPGREERDDPAGIPPLAQRGGTDPVTGLYDPYQGEI